MAPQNPLTIHGNDKTMNLNSLILTNIQSSPYFKVNLYELKTYHEVIDEIYYKVSHLEPWEKGSRKTAGQTGMCGGVRGVGAGGIVSSAYCLLYKLFTLKLTKKQVIGLITHTDSPYIRGLGFMFIRYTQPPGDLWDWYVDYLEDEEEVDVKAGGGHTITMGEMTRQFLTKLEWYSTLFPRIPVPIQKDIQKKLADWDREHNRTAVARPEPVAEEEEAEAEAAQGFGEAERVTQARTSESPRRGKGASSRPSPPFDITREIEREKDRQRPRRDSRERERGRDSREQRDSRERERGRDSREQRDSRERERGRDSREHHRDSRDKYQKLERHRDHREDARHKPDKSRDRRDRHGSRSREKRRSRSPRKSHHRSRSRDKKRDPSPSRSRDHKRSKQRSSREDSYERDLLREKARQRSEKNGY